MPWDSEVPSIGAYIWLPEGVLVGRAVLPVDRAGDEIFTPDSPGHVLSVNEDGDAIFTPAHPGIVNIGDTVTIIGAVAVTGTVAVSSMPDVVMRAEAAWTTLINAIRIDDAPTFYYSAAMDVSDWAAVWILCDVDSTLAPTHLRILPQWSHDGGTTWWDFEEGLWASLGWEDTDTADGINKAYLLPCGGIDLIRIGAIGTGTNAGNFFDVTVLARAFYGEFVAGHA